MDNESQDLSQASNEGIKKECSFFDLLYGVIANPTETLRHIVDTKPVLAAVLLYVVVSLVSGIANIPLRLNRFNQLPLDLSSLNGFNMHAAIFVFIIIGVLIAVFFSLLGFLAFGGICHLFGRLFKGDGKFSGLISGFGFASFPGMLATPLILISLILGESGYILNSLSSLAFAIWVVILEAIAIRENYQFSTGRAVATLISSFLVLCLAAFIIVMVLVLGVTALFFGALASR